MVEAGFTETSALNTVAAPGPSSGSITSDSAVSCSLLALSACCTLGGRLVLTAAAWLGRAKGRSRPARTRGRSVLIIFSKYPAAREKGIGAVRDDGPRTK
ncbi:hypothetical protein D3C81_1951470 [compost metagenome]